jgi:hypothetical protein
MRGPNMPTDVQPGGMRSERTEFQIALPAGSQKMPANIASHVPLWMPLRIIKKTLDFDLRRECNACKFETVFELWVYGPS